MNHYTENPHKGACQTEVDSENFVPFQPQKMTSAMGNATIQN